MLMIYATYHSGLEALDNYRVSIFFYLSSYVNDDIIQISRIGVELAHIYAFIMLCPPRFSTWLGFVKP